MLLQCNGSLKSFTRGESYHFKDSTVRTTFRGMDGLATEFVIIEMLACFHRSEFNFKPSLYHVC